MQTLTSGSESARSSDEYSDTRRCAPHTSFAWCVPLMLLWLTIGCATSDRHGASIESAAAHLRTPAERLQRMAAIEQQQSQQQPSDATNARQRAARELPLPPGIPALLIAMHAPDHPDAHTTLEEMISHYIAAEDWPPGDPPAEAAPLNNEQRDQALKLYARGRDASMANRHFEVATVLQQALQIDPSSVAIMQVLARSYEALSGSDRARELWQTILHLQPNHDEALLRVGLRLTSQQEYSLAIATLGRAVRNARTLDHDPAGDALAWYALAYAARALGHDQAFIDAAHNAIDEPPQATTLYGRQVTSMLQQVGATHRLMGDAWCRLGDFDAALRSYHRAADHALPDPGSLYPRVLYANLMLGRSYGAQYELLSALQSHDDRVSQRLLLLAGYLQQYSTHTDELAAAVHDLARVAHDDTDLALDLFRCRARLLPAPRGLDMAWQTWRSYADSTVPPTIDAAVIASATRSAQRDLASDLIVLSAAQSDERAVDVTVMLLKDMPDESEHFARLLAASTRDLPAALAYAQSLPMTALGRVLAAQLLMAMDSYGLAWQQLAALPADLQQHAQVRASMLQLAATMDEPQLLDHLINITPDEARSTAYELHAQATALRRLGQPQRALETLRTFSISEHDDPVTRAAMLVQEARAHLDLARQGSSDAQQQPLHMQDAAVMLQRTLDMDPENLQPLELLADLYSANGPLRNAERYRDVAQMVFQRGPHSATYLRLAAREHLERQRFHDALEMALILFASDPSDVGAIDLAMACWSQLGRLDLARRWLDEQRDKRPSHPGLLEQTVQVIAALQSMTDAQRWLEEQLQQQPENRAVTRLLEQVARQNGHHTRAAELAAARLHTRPDGIRRDLELAAMEAGQGNMPRAIEHIDRLLQRPQQPTLQQLTNAVGVLNSSRNQWAQRMNETQRAQLNHALRRACLATVEQYPEAPLQMYGLTLRALAEHGEMNDHFDALLQQAIDHAPGGDATTAREALVWRDMAQALVNENLYHAASRIIHLRLRRAPVLDRAATTILTRIAIAVDAMTEDGHERIAPLLMDLHAADRAPAWTSEEHPTLAFSLYEASHVLTLLSNQEGAIALLEASVKRDDAHAMALNNLGYALLESDRLYNRERVQRAEQLLTRAHALDADDPNILDSLGWLRYRQGFFQQFVTTDPQAAPNDLIRPGAIDLIERAVQAMRQPGGEPSAEVLDHYGDVLWRLGRDAEAAEAWQAAYDLLTDPQRTDNIIRNVELIQQRVWGIEIAEATVVHRSLYGALQRRLERKLAAIANEQPPPIAETFVELAAEQVAGGS